MQVNLYLFSVHACGVCVCGGEGGARMHRTKYYSYSYFSFIQLQIMMLYMLAEYATCIQCSESKE